MLLALCFLIAPSSSLQLKKVSETNVLTTENESERHKSKHKSSSKKNQNQATQTPAAPTAAAGAAGAPTNATKLSDVEYKKLNETYNKIDLYDHMTAHRKWDFKLLDTQLKDLYYDMNQKDRTVGNEHDRKAFLLLYINQFEACDKNGDNTLDLAEFTTCMSNDTYLKVLSPPPAQYASYANYSFTNNTGFIPILFGLLDINTNNYTNFHDYMRLRLMIYSWKKCSVMAPFIEEINFECAIQIASGYRSLGRSTLKRLFNLGLELSNSVTLRNMDFITYAIVASSVRVFGKINGKEDSDLTRSEFNMALDSNILPTRYNQDVVNAFFRLTEEHDKPNQGIDVVSFCFYDFILRLFSLPNAQRRYSLNKAEFQATFTNYLFPNKTLVDIMRIPQYNLTNTSYNMYTDANNSIYNSEDDHFLKSFLEASSETSSLNKDKSEISNSKNNKNSNNNGYSIDTLILNNTNLTYNSNKTTTWLFQVLDSDNDGFISFYDYGYMMQCVYLFAKFDIYNKGRIVAGELFEKFTQYSDFPVVSYHIRDRARRFNSFPQDLYFDDFNVVLLLRIDDIIDNSVRRSEKTTLYEVELKTIFNSVNLKNVPEGTLNTCLRGADASSVPVYDWECAFIGGMNRTLLYYESVFSYLTVKTQNLTLSNTAFVNADPSIK